MQQGQNTEVFFTRVSETLRGGGGTGLGRRIGVGIKHQSTHLQLKEARKLTLRLWQGVQRRNYETLNQAWIFSG